MCAAVSSPAAIAEAAFLSAYPLLAGRRRMARDTAVAQPDPATLRAPVNTLVHGRATPDTLRCSGWLDLACGPRVLSVPDTCGRYYALWLRDAWGEVFASLGARTTGTGQRVFALLGPGHDGSRLPAGPTPIASPTRVVHVTGCIEAVRESDVQAHEGFWLAALSDEAEPPAEPLTPIGDIEAMAAQALLAAAARLAAEDSPDPARREPLERLQGLDAPAELDRGVQRGWASVRAAGRAATPDAAGWVRETQDPALDAFHALAVTDSERRPLSG